MSTLRKILPFHLPSFLRTVHFTSSVLLAAILLTLVCVGTELYAQSASSVTVPSVAVEQSIAGNDQLRSDEFKHQTSNQSAGNQESIGIVGYWNALVQTLTLLVVLVYTIVTRQMQQVMARQIKLGVMPSFILGLIQLNMKDPILDVNILGLEITNVGNGTALNIRIDPIHLARLSEKRRKLGEPNLRFNILGLLRRDDKVLVKHRSFSASENIDEDLMVDLDEQYMKPDSAGILFTINFQDIEGNWYQQKVRVSHAGSHPSAVKQASPQNV